MKKLIKIISNFFKRKCPVCNSPMDNVGKYVGGQIYECTTCKRDWI